MTKPALESRWRGLLDLTLTALDTLPGNTARSWGGGAALAQHLGHRVCDDIDIFLSDAVYLPVLSPEFNPKVRAISEAWQERDDGLKLRRPEGTIGFYVAPLMTRLGTVEWRYGDRTLALQTVHEVLTKKLQGPRPTALARDLFDLAAARTLDPGSYVAALETRREGARRLADAIEQQAEQLSRDVPDAIKATIKGEEIMEALDMLDLASELRG